LNYILNIRYIFIRNFEIVIQIFVIHIFTVLFYSHKYVLREVVLSSIIDLCEDINFPSF